MKQTLTVLFTKLFKKNRDKWNDDMFLDSHLKITVLYNFRGISRVGKLVVLCYACVSGLNPIQN